jgi:hypothetical protein
MDEESDEELEEADELMESRVQSSSSQGEDSTEETKVTFRTRRARDSSNVFDFTGPPNGVNRSAASDINPLPFQSSYSSSGRFFKLH